jgi:hypothetical protein
MKIALVLELLEAVIKDHEDANPQQLVPVEDAVRCDTLAARIHALQDTPPVDPTGGEEQ